MRSRFDRHPRRFPVSKPATKGGLGHRQPVLLYEIVTVLEHGVSGVLVSQIDTYGSLRLRDLGFGLLGLLLAILLHGWSDLLGTLSAVCAVPLARVPRPAVSSHLLPGVPELLRFQHAGPKPGGRAEALTPPDLNFLRIP